MCKLYIVLRTSKFTRNIKGSSRMLSLNRYYGLSPLMIVLTCTLKFGLKWSYLISRTSLQMLLNFMTFFVSLSGSFADAQRKGLASTYMYITLEFFTEFCKVGLEKNWAGKWDCSPSLKLSSFHSSKNCECCYCTPITVPTRQTICARIVLVPFKLTAVYKWYYLFYS